MDAVLFRPIPYPEPDRLARLFAAVGYRGQENLESQTGHAFLTIRDAAPGLEVAAYGEPNGANLAGQGRPEYVKQQRISARYFRVLGVYPQFGREFSRVEDSSGGPAVAVLSYDFAGRLFRGNPQQALGRPVSLRGEPYTVVGIMPRSFRADSPVDVWTPLRPSRFGEGGGANYGAIARLRPGVSWAQATGQLQALSQSAHLKEGYGQDIAFEERLVPYQKGATQDVRGELWIAWGAVLVVLLIGCVNIAGLLLARSASRAHEFATRMAVGGSRIRIVRQLLTESLVLALGGCLVGLAAGAFAIDGLKRLGAGEFELWHPITLDLRVFAGTVAIAVLTGLVFGLVPALETSRIDIRSVLVEAGRGVAGSRRRWPRNLLLAGQVALSLMLLVSAGLLVRTLVYLHNLNPGFDTRNVVSAKVSLQDARYQTRDAVNQLYTASLERMRRIPGVESAAVALTLPYERPLNDGFRTLDGSDTARRMGEFDYVTAGYFSTMRIPILRGREFRDSDTAESGKVVVVSQSFANRYYQGREALGGHLQCGRGACEIVGIVGDVRQHSGLTDAGGPIAIEPTIYVPVTQTTDGFLQLVHTWFTPTWVIRTRAPVHGLEPQIQGAVAAVDPQLPIAEFQTMEQLRGKYIGSQRYLATLLSALAGLALLLSAIGLAGLIGQSITERTHEIGVQLALGATAGQVMIGAIRPALILGLAGVASGLVLAAVSMRLLKHMLWGVQPTDMLTFLATSLVLLTVTVVASALPALRILRMDPAKTLRAF